MFDVSMPVTTQVIVYTIGIIGIVVAVGILWVKAKKAKLKG